MNSKPERLIANPEDKSTPMLVLEDIHLAYDGHVVLDGISLKLYRNEMLAVVGPSGSGKSTLVKIIAGLEQPDSGRVYLASDRVGLAFQYGALFTSLTVEQNIALALERRLGLDEEAVSRRINEVLAMVELQNVRDSLPDELSGGMQKRVGIARALAIDPDIMLYDEPTVGLDPMLATKLELDLRRINRERHMASIVVTHELPTIRNLADRVVFLHEGRFVYEGSREDFFTTDNPYVREFRKRIETEQQALTQETDANATS